MRSRRANRPRLLERPGGSAFGVLRGGLAPGILALALAAGCASGGGREPGTGGDAAPGTAATVVVENTESPGSSLSIQLESSTGDRTILGSVGPRRTETFEVGNVSPNVSYRLVAGVTGGGDVVSERFTLSPGARVRWVLPFNTLRTGQ